MLIDLSLGNRISGEFINRLTTVRGVESVQDSTIFLEQGEYFYINCGLC